MHIFANARELNDAVGYREFRNLRGHVRILGYAASGIPSVEAMLISVTARAATKIQSHWFVPLASTVAHGYLCALRSIQKGPASHP